MSEHTSNWNDAPKKLILTLNPLGGGVIALLPGGAYKPATSWEHVFALAQEHEARLIVGHEQAQEIVGPLNGASMTALQ
jgi:hypothetical protein